MAASAQGTQMIVSSLASQSFTAIAKAADQPGCGKPWFQLYWQGNRKKTLRLLDRALDAGFATIVFTVDAPVKVASLQLPQHIQAVNLESSDAPVSSTSMVFDGWMAQAPTWDDLDWLRAQTKLPLLVKGLLHPDDASRAAESGCDGIVVSNHGGRVLKNAVPSLLALEQIAARIAGRIPVLFDSGIRSGQDVYTALAFGASAVLLGRPYIWGLAAEGALGVARVIRLLRDELEMTMALTGCARLADINRESVVAISGSAVSR
jgi:4-hydroxymandelate oxidase